MRRLVSVLVFSIGLTPTVAGAQDEPAACRGLEAEQRDCGGDFDACFTLLAGVDDIPSVGEPIQFCDRSRGQPDGWCWKFGDGDGESCDSREQHPIHVFERPGPIEVILEARRDDGVGLRIATSPPLRREVCQPRPQRDTLLLGPTGGEAVVPIDALDGCVWSVRSTDAEILGDRSGVGTRDVWVRLGGEQQESAEIRVVAEGGRSVDLPIERLPFTRRVFDISGPRGTFRQTYYPCPGGPPEAPCAGTTGAPILLLTEGPSMSAEEVAADGRLGLIRSVAPDRPLVIVEARDRGPLRCRVERLELPTGVPITEPALLAEAERAVTECRESRIRRGLDLENYRTEILVDDLEVVRKRLRSVEGLQAERIILWSEGYGSQLALAYLAEYGGRVERAVLHAPRRVHKTISGPLALERVLRGVEAAFPGLIGDLEAVLAGLASAAAPPRIALLQPDSNGELRLQGSAIGSLDVQQAVAWGLLSRRRTLELQTGVSQMLAGDPDLIREAVAEQVAPGCDLRSESTLQSRRVATRGECIGSALTFAVNCALLQGSKRLDRRAERTVLGRALEFPYPEICSAWGVARSSRLDTCAEGVCPSTTVPILLITAALDPLANDGDARRVGTRLNRVLGRHAAVSKLEILNGMRDDLFDPRLLPKLVDFFASEDSRTYPPLVLPLE